MSKQSKNGPSGSKTLSQQDKEMGFQLLLSPKATVNVLTPSVAHESSHLYPKLAGPNWTCYITGDVIRLGRRPEHTPPSNNNSNKIAVDVDFCGNKQVSRRHADIKFNTKKNYWELRVYGRIGVKVNHNLVTKKQHPVPLTAMAYLDIGGNGFVFVLPDHTDGIPGKDTAQPTNATTASSSETAPPPPPPPPTTNSQPDITLEDEKNDHLATIIVDVVKSLNKKTWQLTTEQIFKAAIQFCRKKSLDSSECTMDSVLRALVFNSQFRVTKECLEMTAQQSDKVKWCWELPASTPSPTLATTATATGSFDTSNSEAWSDFGYDFRDGSDPTGETNEELSTTAGTPMPMDSGPWMSSNIPEATVTTSTNNRPLSAAAVLTPPAVTTPAANVSSPTLSSGHPAAENETYSSTMTSAPLSQITSTTIPSIISSSQTTSTTVPSIVSSSINRSLGERTLSGLSITDDGPFPEAPDISGKTPWTPLELYHVSAFPDQHAAIPGYSRGLSLFHMYSSILATRHQSGIDMDESPSVSTPCTLFPTAPAAAAGDDDDIDFNLACSTRKRKRYSTSDHEDRRLWTRFRTTVFK